MAAVEHLIVVIIEAVRATKAVKTIEVKIAMIQQEAAMPKRHQVVSNEYIVDAMKIKQHKQALIADREYADQADFIILSSFIANATASRCNKRRCSGAANQMNTSASSRPML